MREIKFRVWDKELEYMAVDPEDYDMEYFMYMDGEMVRDGTPLNMKTYVIMQFTGLFDKNKKEIFEGDLLKHDLWGTTEVVWDIGGFRGQSKSDKENDRYDVTLADHQLKRSRVIGNIYENKELLEEGS